MSELINIDIIKTRAMQAYLDNKPIAANPYQEGTEAYGIWNQQYMQMVIALDMKEPV